MSDQPGNTTILQGLLDRLANGDPAARDELIKHSMKRLHGLAKKLLRQNPAVRRWNETDDVFQNAMVRLHRALETERPDSVKRLVGLAALQIRRELVDLGRKHYGPQGVGAHHASDPGLANSQGAPKFEGVSPDETEQLAMHEAVDSLAADLREVFELTVYAGMTQDEIAQIVGVSTKTVKRRWRDARLQLQDLLSETQA